ncbi:hypothetical protein [Leclercia adecarboxylata]|uniref:hypothetical protein n=1 Tax=Leclercia adecarboxylata TaxID=83655 RepID=UPI003D2753BA
MQVIVVYKNETPFIYTLPKYESVFLYQEDKGNVQVLGVSIHFLEKEDKNVCTIITASERMITNTELKKLVSQLHHPT